MPCAVVSTISDHLGRERAECPIPKDVPRCFPDDSLTCRTGDHGVPRAVASICRLVSTVVRPPADDRDRRQRGHGRFPPRSPVTVWRHRGVQPSDRPAPRTTSRASNNRGTALSSEQAVSRERATSPPPRTRRDRARGRATAHTGHRHVEPPTADLGGGGRRPPGALGHRSGRLGRRAGRRSRRDRLLSIGNFDVNQTPRFSQALLGTLNQICTDTRAHGSPLLGRGLGRSVVPPVAMAPNPDGRGRHPDRSATTSRLPQGRGPTILLNRTRFGEEPRSPRLVASGVARPARNQIPSAGRAVSLAAA